MNRITFNKNLLSAAGMTAFIVGVLFVAGCGQRGPLYLPDQPAETVQEPQDLQEQSPGTLQEDEENEENSGT